MSWLNRAHPSSCGAVWCRGQSLQGSQSLMHESLAEIAGIAQSAVQTGQ